MTSGRTWLALVGISFTLAVAACGPSAQQVQTAKTASYKPPAATIFSLAMAAADEEDKIAGVKEAEGAFITMGHWYSPEGTRQSAGANDKAQIGDGYLNVALLVQVAEQNGTVQVKVTPVVAKYKGGSPMPQKIAPDDPSMPGWVQGKVDNMTLAIYTKAKAHAVTP